MTEDKTQEPQPPKNQFPKMDTLDLRKVVDSRYSVPHPPLIEGDQPKSIEEAEIRNLEDAVDAGNIRSSVTRQGKN